MTRGLVCVAALAACAAGGAGVVTAAAQADTTARDTTARRDTTAPRDTTARDTTAAYLPVFAPPTPAGPLPAGARYSFSVDSCVLSNVQTLSDLLAHIPGVFVARGGFFGQAEPVLYGGRGAAGLEIYWDGLPYVPLGRDSVFVDPARISLAPLERVDVVVLPAALRVYLVTARQSSTAPATHIRVATGQFSTATYRGSYARRWRSGIGLSLFADYNNNDGVAKSASGPFNSVDIWLNAQWVPSPRFGLSYQIRNSSWKRNETTDGRTDRFRYHRRDGILRAFVARRGDGLGPRAELTLASVTADRDTAVAARSLKQAMLAISNSWGRAHAGLTLRASDDDARPWQVEAEAAWRPIRPLTLAADARHARYRGGSSGDRAHLAAGLALPLGFSAHGDAAWGKDLQAPALSTDTLQETVDLSGALRWDRNWAMVEVGRARRDAFAPLGRPAGLKPLGGLNPGPRSDYFTAHGSIRPLPGLYLGGWYMNPLAGGGNDFEPPDHARVSATFYSKFWRVYRSGIFALRAEAAMESWSRGRGGRDSLGTALTLPGATFIEFNVEVRVAGVTIYWIQRNTQGMRVGYVPGLDYPKRFQFYGVQWVFTN